DDAGGGDDADAVRTRFASQIAGRSARAGRKREREGKRNSGTQRSVSHEVPSIVVVGRAERMLERWVARAGSHPPPRFLVLRRLSASACGECRAHAESEQHHGSSYKQG